MSEIAPRKTQISRKEIIDLEMNVKESKHQQQKLARAYAGVPPLTGGGDLFCLRLDIQRFKESKIQRFKHSNLQTFND